MTLHLCSPGGPLACRVCSRNRQSGIAALAFVIVLLLASAGWLAAGVVRAQIAQSEGRLAGERDALRQAQQAIVFFAGARSRLPCPALAAGGAEDCLAGDPQWLPAATLGLAGGRAGHAGVPVRYLLYPGPVEHMAAVTESADAAPDDPAPSGPAVEAGAAGRAIAANGLEFCSRLQAQAALAAPAATGAGSVPGAPAPSAAYALAVHGTGVQASTSPAFLYGRFECATALASVGAVAQAADLVQDATDLQASNLKKSDNLLNVARMIILHRALEVELAHIDLAAGLYTLLDNQFKLQAAIAAAAAGLPQPEAIATFIAGIAGAQRALALNALDLPRAAVSLALDSSTLQRYQAVSGRALDAAVWQSAGEIASQAKRAGLGMEHPAGIVAPARAFSSAGAPG